MSNDFGSFLAPPTLLEVTETRKLEMETTEAELRLGLGKDGRLLAQFLRVQRSNFKH